MSPGLRNLEIRYTGLSYVNPERVQFKYRLLGLDRAFIDAGSRREALYNNLRPGTYTFEVFASNNDGVWNTEGDRLSFVIPPAWFQTTWFKTIVVLAALCIVYLIVLTERRRYTTAVKARFQERLDERIRIAQTLHDTLLQTIQGSKMIADHAQTSISDPGTTQKLLRQLSEWLGRASLEGRMALESLRASEAEDLSSALRTMVAEYREGCEAELMLSIEGPDREMKSLVRDEVHWIAYEAIRNACNHSGARTVSITLVNTQDLELCIRDDGKGIPSEILLEGKAGHFGLRGMRERASHIGATLTIASSTGTGTEVTLLVPGKKIFVASSKSASSIPSLWSRLARPNRR